MSDDKKTRYPCDGCGHLGYNGGCSCYHNCGEFREWFSAEWRRVVEPFRELGREIREQKEKGEK